MKAKDVLTELKRRFPNEPEYHQAVEEVLNTIEDTYNRNIEFEKSNLIERLCIPDRIFSFRVTWTDDQGNVHTNMGYRIQHNKSKTKIILKLPEQKRPSYSLRIPER